MKYVSRAHVSKFLIRHTLHFFPFRLLRSSLSVLAPLRCFFLFSLSLSVSLSVRGVFSFLSSNAELFLVDISLLLGYTFFENLSSCW